MSNDRKWRAGAGVMAGVLAAVVVGVVANFGGSSIDMETAWQLHQIVVGVAGSGNPDGADGVDVLDINGDGLLDVVSGHEQGSRVTVSLHPHNSVVEDPWPTVTLPNTVQCNYEDATFGDVDQDGAIDVIAACEVVGATTNVQIFFAPTNPASLLTAGAWTRVDITAATNRSMRVELADVAGDDSPEIVVGEKESPGEAALVYYSSETPRTAASWTRTVIVPVGWTMQMYVQDLDGDTDIDIVYTDREPIDFPASDDTKRGLRWLESDGASTPSWTEHQISAVVADHKWFSLRDWDDDGDLDIFDCRSTSTPTNEGHVFVNAGNFASFADVVVAHAADVGICVHHSAEDIDQDGQIDLAYSYAQAPSLSGLVWQRVTGSLAAPTLERGEISGVLSANDTKFDNLIWADIDGDGDKDAVSSEQHLDSGTGPGLGVVYAENPLNTFVAPPAPPNVTCTLLTSGSTSTDGTSVVTASVTPAANRLVLAAVLSGGANLGTPPTATGNGLTYVQAATQLHPNTTRRATLFRAMGASPSAGAITFNFSAGTQTAFVWSVIECSGVDTGGTDGSAAVAQTVTNTVAAATTINATLSAFGSSSNRAVAFVGLDIQSSVTPDADFTELSDNAIGSGAMTMESETAVNQTTCDPTFSTNNALIIAAEVKVAP